jgi:deoxyribonuclease IV
MRLGVHVSIQGGFHEAVVRASRLRCTAMQMFSRSPRGGTAPSLSREAAVRFDAARRAAGIDPLAIHGPYIINLASPEARMWQQSVRLFREEYARAAQLGADLLVIHVGSHKGAGEAQGMRRVADAVNRVLDGTTPTTMILLENTAGSAHGIGQRFEHLAAMRERIEAKASVGFCLDTAHLFAAGHPIHTPRGLTQVAQAIDEICGWPQVRLIHLNDSKSPFESRVDRHWHIGQGHIGRAAFRRIVNHPRLRRIPWILETPKSIPPLGPLRGPRLESPRARRGTSEAGRGASDEADRRNLGTVRRLAGGNSPARTARSGRRAVQRA